MQADLTVFEPVRAALAEYKELNAKMVFDYEDPKSNKEARSHVHKLRGVKSEITRIHRDAKADALRIGQAYDEEKRARLAEVEEMIEVHARPIREIEEREAIKLAAAEKAAEDARLAEEARQRKELEEAQAKVAAEKAEVEARERAVAEKEAKAKADAEAVEQAKRDEADAIERAKRLASLAEEARLKAIEDAKVAEAARIEREKRIAEDAAQKARFDAEAKAKADADAKAAAEAKAAESERLRIENQDHQDRVHGEILAAIFGMVGDKDMACRLTKAIQGGRIPFVIVKY